MFCLHVCVCVICMPSAFEGQRECWILWDQDYDWIKAVIWVLGTTSGLLERTAILTIETSVQP